MTDGTIIAASSSHDDPALALDLDAESETLHQAAALRETGHHAKTLLRQADLRVVLIALSAGARLHEHKTDNSITVQTLAGRVRMQLPDKAIVVPAHGMLFLDRGVPHDLVAEEDSTVLLTIHWAPATV